MNKVKNVFAEAAGIFFLRAFLVLLLTAIPSYINQLSSGATLSLEELGDYGVASGAVAVILAVLIAWSFFGGGKVSEFWGAVGSKKPFTKVNLRFISITAICFGVIYFLLIVSGTATVDYRDFSADQILQRIYLLGLILLVIYSDELLFRGYIMTRLEDRKYPIRAIACSCIINVLFLIVHMFVYRISIVSWINAIVIMLICTVLYARYHNVFLTVCCRAIWTFLSVLLFNVQFMNISREESMVIGGNLDNYSTTLKTFGLTNSWIITIALLFMLSAVGLTVHKVNS